MKHCITYRLAVTAMALFSLAACQKDEPRINFALRVADRYDTGDSKVYMNGLIPVFSEDEAIKINGENYLVDTRNGSPAVYDVVEASHYYAFYPGTWVNGDVSASPGVTFPDMQVYRTDASGHQLVENPMVAYTSSDGATLEFHNVAALANVHITNYYGSPLKIKYVALYTDNTPLCGPATIEGFTGSTPTVSLASGGITNVSIDCSTMGAINNGRSADITFALPPISNVVLYVDVYMTSSDGNTKYSFTKRTANGKTIGRNQMGDINVVLRNTGDDQVKTCGEFWGSGDSEDDPFIIMSKADLVRLQTLVASGDDDYNNPDVFYLQTANIDLSEELSWAGVGTSTYPFEASYDGSEASVTLNIHSVTTSTGVFGYVKGTETADGTTFIKNLHVKGSIDNNAAYAVGGICGTVSDAGTLSIENCSSDVVINGTLGTSNASHIMGGIVGDIAAGNVSISDCQNNGYIHKIYGYAGGIVGHVASTATGCLIDACTNNPMMKSLTNGYMGGICGYAESATTIQRCKNNGDMVGSTSGTGSTRIGGIVGQIMHGTIDKCTNKGAITGYYQVGGIGGYVQGDIVKRCHNTSMATITAYGSTGVGGIVGYAYTNVLTIDGCLNEASVTITGTPSWAEMAGIVGYNNVVLTIKNTGNRGNVNSNGQKNAAGFVGRSQNTVTVVNCFERATLTATSSWASGMLAPFTSGLTLTFRNCYVYDSRTASAYATLSNRLSNSQTINQAYCYDNVGDGTWGNATGKNMMNAACKFAVTGTGPYTIKCATAKAANTYWSSTDVTLLDALNNWCTTPLDNDGSTAYGSSSDYLTWKADSDGFPTLNFDFIE